MLLYPISAYRFWSIIRKHDEYLLVSPSYFSLRLNMCAFLIWTPDEPFEARDLCPIFSNINPGMGIYGLKEVGSLQEYYQRCHLIYGRVQLWGKVRVHRKGYRGQYGYPQELLGSRCIKCGRFFDDGYLYPYCLGMIEYVGVCKLCKESGWRDTYERIDFTNPILLDGILDALRYTYL